MRALAEQLAAAFLAGDWEVDGLYQRGALLLGKRSRWLQRLSRHIHARGEGVAALRRDLVVEWIIHDTIFLQAFDRYDLHAEAQVWNVRPAMRPALGPPSDWRLPHIVTFGELAEWLGIQVNELEWFADRRRCQQKLDDGPLRHYRHRWIAKRHGEVRLLEIPKPRLRSLQRQLLRRLLDYIPPHDAAHGFRSGRSIRSYAAPHAGQRVVIRIDLRDFFPTIQAGRVLPIFLTAGYPEPVARLLTGLCTHAVAAAVFDEAGLTGEVLRRMEFLYSRPHLPQGAPTSPVLANLVAYRLDCRLAGLAASLGARYTRYADDLAFSGGRELERAARRFHVQVAAIALEEGFAVHTRKTRIMREGSRQRLAGVIINRHPNLARGEFDRLKAILYNCVVSGPRGQNRAMHADFRAHLAGAIAFAEMVNPDRGKRLRELFERITW